MLFVFSQIFAVINYLFIMLSYAVKKRKQLLIYSFLSLIANGLSYVFLAAWSGLAMVGVAILRNIIFLFQNKKENDKTISAQDWIILSFLILICSVLAFVTYSGFLSLFSVFATILYTVSVWQKNIFVYNICGIIVSVLWIIYDIFVFSPLAIVCEIVMLLFVLVSLIVRLVKKRKNKQECGLDKFDLKEKDFDCEVKNDETV